MAGNGIYRRSVSDHFDGTRFFNPGQPGTDRSLREVLRWRFGPKGAVWPERVAVTQVVPAARVAGLRVTMVGHASLLIQAAGVNVLTDPVWAERAGPMGLVGPRRVCAPGVAFGDLPPIDAVLISHNHYDHLDVATLRRLVAAQAPLVVAPLGNEALLRRAVPGIRVVVGDWWDRIEVAPGVTTTLTRANHWSRRGVRDKRRALWAGHFLETVAGRVWFAGDTGFGDGGIFADVRARCGVADMALIPIGAYAPRWFMAAQHVDPEEAVRILGLVGARFGVGIHWGVFQLTDEAREEPVERLAAALAGAGRFVAAEPGAVFDIGSG